MKAQKFSKSVIKYQVSEKFDKKTNTIKKVFRPEVIDLQQQIHSERSKTFDYIIQNYGIKSPQAVDIYDRLKKLHEAENTRNKVFNYNGEEIKKQDIKDFFTKQETPKQTKQTKQKETPKQPETKQEIPEEVENE